GLLRALDSIDKGNNVGFLTFSDDVNTRIPVGPYPQTRYAIADAVDAMRAAGQTALYEAIRDAITMTDGAEGADDAIRGVVVLTDGKANRGNALDSLVRMTSKD